mmetsp:Transcript_38818/g.62871  ORF Transcript_38818/g.62871 Transcript_38818/m.62871 type:complete len:141 (+) Transcript_38818:418-840(+)
MENAAARHQFALELAASQELGIFLSKKLRLGILPLVETNLLLLQLERAFRIQSLQNQPAAETFLSPNNRKWKGALIGFAHVDGPVCSFRLESSCGERNCGSTVKIYGRRRSLQDGFNVEVFLTAASKKSVPCRCLVFFGM